MINKDFFEKIIRYSFYILLFFTPLLFSPINYELFEFPKMIFVYAMTVIIVGAWFGKIIVEKEIKIQKTPLDIPIILYLLSNILSTIFSIDPHTSVWGYYSRFHGGLLSTIAYILLYYAFVSNMGKNGYIAAWLNSQKNKITKKSINHSTINNQPLVINCIYLLLVSALLVSIYGILEHFGIDAKYWVQDVKNRVFSTLGQPNWLGAFIDALIFIPLGLALSFKNQKKSSYILYLTSYILLFLCLIFTNSKSAILAFWLGLIAFSLFFSRKEHPYLKKIGLVWISTLAIYLLIGGRTFAYLNKAPLWLKIVSHTKIALPPKQFKGNGQYVPFVSESSDIRKVVWQGAIKIWQNYPVFGSGLETFGYAYYNFRPQEHNLLSEWDFLYNKAHNEFLNILASQGTLGLASYLLLIGSFLWWGLKNVKCQMSKFKDLSCGFELLVLNFAFIAGYITILITNFFGFSVVIIGLLFFLIPAFCFSLPHIYKPCKDRVFTCIFPPVISDVKTRSLHKYQYLLLIITCLVSLYLIIYIINLWRSDYYYNQSEKQYKANYLVNALTLGQKAIKLNPNEALFHSQLSVTASKMAAAYYQTDASGSAEIIDQLKNLSLDEAEITLKLNPVHINLYKALTKTYVYLSLINPKYNAKAISLLEKASILAPTDAKILDNLAILYEQEDEVLKSQSIWEKAIELKPDYRKVYLELAESYIKIKNPDKAKAKLNYIINNINAKDEVAINLLKELEEK